jgi:hypothetical protein
MKRLVFSITMMSIISVASFCQNPAFDEAFEKYALKDGFVTVNVSSELLNMFLSAEDKIQDVKIGNIKILSIEDTTLNEGLNFYNEIIPKLELNDYRKLIHVKEEGSQVVIMKKKKSKGQQEFLLVTGGDDNVMIYIEGNLDFQEVNKISKVLNSESLMFMTSSN